MMTEERANYWRIKYAEFFKGFRSELEESGDEGVAFLGVLRIQGPELYHGAATQLVVGADLGLIQNLVAQSAVELGELAALLVSPVGDPE